MAEPLSWEEWTKRFNESGAPAGPAAPATTAGLSQSDLGNVATIFDPNFGRTETLTHAAEDAVGGGWGGGGFAGGHGLKLLDSERKSNMLLGHQILEPYLQREQAANLQAESEHARLNEIAAQGAQALQQLQLSEAGQTARLNAAQKAEMERLIQSGNQAMEQLKLRETGDTARQTAGIKGTLANTIVSEALRGGGGGSGGARVPGVGTGTPGEFGITWNRGVPQYGGTPSILTAPTPGAAYNPNARGVTTPASVLGGSSIDTILRKYGLMTMFMFAAFFLCGCNTSEIEKKSDGAVRAFNSRWFWSTESYEVEYSTNGFKVKATKSNPDAESLRAVAEGAAQGAVKGAKP